MAKYQCFTLDNNGYKFNCYKYGQGEKTLLIVHGAATESMGFDDFIEKFNNEWTVYIYDRRGYGKNDKPTRYDLVEQIKDLSVVAEFINRPFTLLAHSLGSTIALAYAYQNPKYIQKLVLYEPFLCSILPKGHWYYDKLDKTKSLLWAGKKAEAMNVFFSLISYDKERQRPLSRQLLKTLRKNFDVFFDGEFIDSTLFKLEYEKLSMPVYVGVGELSKGGVVEDGIKIFNKKTNCQIFTTSGAHNMFYDRPQEFYDSIMPVLSL